MVSTHVFAEDCQGSHSAAPEERIKTILFWNSFFSRKDYGFGLGRQKFQQCKCPESRCQTTTDKSLFPTADAVIFHSRDPYFLAHPEELPMRSNPGQIYIFYNFEAPMRSGERLKNYTDVFNLTMTYREDSDIAVPLWNLVKRTEPKTNSGIGKSDLGEKTRTAVWFISNCEKDGSRRWQYAMKLSQYIDLDIYGTCGNLSCPKSKADHSVAHDCFRMAGKTHRFYLAFENAFCRDYRTEKIIIAWTYKMIPVVLGGFGSLLPPKSALDVTDFNGPKELARKMKYLQNHDKKYLKYFEFNKYYINEGRGCDKGFCRLCEILHNPDYRYHSGLDVYQWWVEGGRCLEEDDAARVLGL